MLHPYPPAGAAHSAAHLGWVAREVFGPARRGIGWDVLVGQLEGRRYRLLDRLGAGGMSVVWRAHDDLLERDVAIKVLAVEGDSGADLMHRIRVEARSAARLRHPNVVEVYDYGQAAGTDGAAMPYVVMELIDGRGLDQLLTAGALPWRLAVLIGAQVAAALAAAHAQGIVHRDVKPGNVMVTAAGVKLVDFGISAAIGEADGVDGEVLGTPAYLAPERIDGGPVRPATDVYALGLLLYRMLAGQLPWHTSTVTEMLSAHRYQEPADLPAVAGLTPEVTQLCRTCLAKEPDERPTAATAARILADAAGLGPASLLRAAVDSPSGPSSSSPSVSTVAYKSDNIAATDSPASAPTVRPRRVLPGSRRARVAAAGTAGLILLGTLVGWVSANDGSPDAHRSAGSATVSSGPTQAVTCTVDYAVRSAANGRASTAVTVFNTGTTPLNDWQLSFALPTDQRLVRGWSGHWQQTGQSVQTHGTNLPAQGFAATGFDAAYAGVNGLPTRFELDGTACTSNLSVAGQTSRPAPRNSSSTDPSPADTTAAADATTTTGKAKKQKNGGGNKNGKKSKDQ